MVEVLPNGENKIVKTSDQVDTATLERLVQQEAALKLVIAQDTKLESENVSVSLAPLSNLEDTERLQLSCSIVLNTVSTFDKKIINNVIEDILNTFEESSDMHVSKENIVMVNSNNDVLY